MNNMMSSNMMRNYSNTTTLNLTVVKPRQRGPNVRLAVLISFAAGVIIGVPLTFGALFLCTPGPADEAFRRLEVTPGRSEPWIIRGAFSASPGLPSAVTNIRKSGLGVPRAGEKLKEVPHSGTQSNLPDGGTTALPHMISGTRIDSERFLDGIFWTELSESLVPRGFDDSDVSRWRGFLNASRVLRVEEGCGRMQNRLVTLSEGRASCCRYRHNNDQIQGEIFSFYLGRLLGIDNLPPSALSLADPRNIQWSSASSQVALAGWNPERPAVLTQFVPDLQPAFMPVHLRDSKSRRLHPGDLSNLTMPDIPDLVQWSDLVVFDYLTANLDRVVNNMYNERWNPGMMSEPAHNLARTPAGLLLFLDNESGLLHGYRLLEKYEHFHRALLDALCLFRRSTIRVLDRLHREDNVEVHLRRAFAEGDPGMSEWLPFLPDRSVRTLKDRIAQVLRQVEKCKSRFESSSRKPVTGR